MLKTTTWRRDLGGLLAACILALLVVAPTIVSAACVCDERLASATAPAAFETEQKHPDAPCKAACCLGGHCHHGGSLLDADFVTVATPTPETAVHGVTPARALASRVPSPPDQPPRA